MLPLHDSMQRSLRCSGSYAFGNISSFSALNRLMAAYVPLLIIPLWAGLVAETSQVWNLHRLAMQIDKCSGF
jgi:hypothetical protein